MEEILESARCPGYFGVSEYAKMVMNGKCGM